MANLVLNYNASVADRHVHYFMHAGTHIHVEQMSKITGCFEKFTMVEWEKYADASSRASSIVICAFAIVIWVTGYSSWLIGYSFALSILMAIIEFPSVALASLRQFLHEKMALKYPIIKGLLYYLCSVSLLSFDHYILSLPSSPKQTLSPFK